MDHLVCQLRHFRLFTWLLPRHPHTCQAPWPPQVENHAGYSIPATDVHESGRPTYWTLLIEQASRTLAVDEPKRKVRKTQATMAAAGRQPRGEKFPMIIPEFLEKTMVATTSTVKTPPKSLLSADECRLLGVPMPSKLLKLEEGKGPGGVHIAGIGILRSPAQFCRSRLSSTTSI